MNLPNILHVVKWFPNPSDPQNGSFVRTQIESADCPKFILGFVDFSGAPVTGEGLEIFGARGMSLAAKLGTFIAKIEAFQPEVVHFHCFAPDLVPMAWWCRQKGIPYLHSEHWSGFLPGRPAPFSGIKAVLARYYFEGAARVLPVSDLLGEGLANFAPKAPLQTLPNAITSEPSPATAKQPSFSFCVVADTVFHIKQHDKILEAFSALPRARCELHFYGSGPDQKRLEELTRTLPNVYVHGRLSNADILRELPRHHALIQFSAYETFGIAPFEARINGLWALVSPNLGGAPYYDDGVKVVSTKEELTQAMMDLLDADLPSVGHFPSLSPELLGNSLSNLYQTLRSE